MKAKKLGKELDRGLDHLAVRMAQTAQRQAVPVWSYYVGRTDCPQWDRLVVALAEFLAIDGWPTTDKDLAKLRRRKGLGKPIEHESAAVQEAKADGGIRVRLDASTGGSIVLTHRQADRLVSAINAEVKALGRVKPEAPG